MKSRKKLLQRILLGTLWTAAFVSILYALDRGIFGPVTHPGWIEASRLDQVPRLAGQILVPAYLPQPLSWPPARILYRTKPATGWWVEVAASGQNKARVWIGVGEPPMPDAIKELDGCFHAERGGRCPQGWHLLSTRIEKRGAPAYTVFVLTDLERLEAFRVLEGLRL